MASILMLSIERFKKGLSALEEVINRTDIERAIIRDTSLLRFALVSELAVKSLKRFVQDQYGISSYVPKTTYREAHRAGIISEAETEIFLRLVDDRNRMVHDYSEEFAEALFARIRDNYLPVLQKLLALMATA